MVENIKTGTLWFLILLSVFLTYQIWTFQPNYAILKSTEYIDNTQIGEEKKLHEIIQPKEVVLHQGEKHFIPFGNRQLVEKLFNDYLGITLDKFRVGSNVATSDLKNSEVKLEFIFPSSVPIEIVKEIYPLGNIEHLLLKRVDQVIFFLVKENEKEQVNVMFISNSEKIVVEAQTNILAAKLKENVQGDLSEELTEVFAFELDDYGDGFNKTTYLPKSESYLESVTYLAKPISTEHFKQVLFSAPNFVKQYFQSNGEESFTDGNRMVNIIQNGNILRYINPTLVDLVEKSNKHVLFTGIDFINSHGGFTNLYYFDSVKHYGMKEEVTFRLAVDGLSVYGTSLKDLENLFEITLLRGGGNHFEQYVRPLFVIESEPVNISKITKLPSGTKLIEALEKLDNFDRSLLTNIDYGFQMIKRQSFVIFEPMWFIQYNGHWQKVHFGDDHEEVLNELE